MLLAEEFLHVGSADDGLLILTFTSRSGQPHEIALPEDQAVALTASLLDTSLTMVRDVLELRDRSRLERVM